ncbi:MAG: phosphotransferase [Pseudonocardiaceae bacterium]
MLRGKVTLPWGDIYDIGTAHVEAAAGYYNRNVRVDTPTGPVNVRIPIHGADIMDLRLWREEEILPAITTYIRHAPRLLHASAEPRYQVHEFIDGPVLNAIAPRGVLVPPHVPADVVALLTELSTIPRSKLPDSPADWPHGDDTIAFAWRLSEVTEQIHYTYRNQYAQQFQAFGFPADPLQVVEAAWPSFTRRPLVCIHSDIHRKNMIIKDGKMGYSAERNHVLQLWQAALSREYIEGWEHDLDTYLAHEQIKSAIVDTVRYSQASIDPSYAPEPEHVLVDKLTVKLNNAYRRWAVTERVDADTVEARLRDWAQRLSAQ